MAKEKSGEYNQASYWSKQIGANAIAAAGTSPFGVVLQNAIVQKAQNPLQSYKDIFKVWASSGGSPAFYGFMPFCARMSFSAATLVPATDYTTKYLERFLPGYVPPIVAGAVMGIAEALLTGMAEKKELKAMTGRAIKCLSVIKGAGARNSVEWATYATTAKYCHDNEISENKSGMLGFIAGGFSGVASMPFQNTLILSAINGDAISKNLAMLTKHGMRAAFSGCMPRVLGMAMGTGAASFASRYVDAKHDCRNASDF